jgi:hypothetical protein
MVKQRGAKTIGLLLVALAFSGLAAHAQAKQDAGPAPCRVDPQPDPCGTTPSSSSKPSSAQKFPFPGETSSPDGGKPSLTGVPSAPDAAGAPAVPAAKKDFPFPGEAGSPPDASAAGSSSSSSSANGDTPQYDPNAGTTDPALTDKGSEGASATPGRHLLHRVNPVGTKLQSADERESEDLDIAHYYMESGDFKGAYLRSQDAVKTDPDDPGAHFLLAQMAQKLNKRDEAIAEYSACLKLDAPEKQAKEARKALAALKP